uniref:Putative truncated transposase n=1 Tax=Streptomyces ambofaciens (strain ATCC 23877 / 3486 / DSM 40053 / JCM 4204 / NBRC 12836 / NRRL B-2516) TaxID=278992 RepID=A0ADB6_STRA7|nr:putative truncated transposase [Streptomyces ambofaciens ATCC 23877]
MEPMAARLGGDGDRQAPTHFITSIPEENGTCLMRSASPAVTPRIPADARPVQPVCAGTGRPPKTQYPEPARTVKDLVIAAGRTAARPVSWREGSRPGKAATRTAPIPPLRNCAAPAGTRGSLRSQPTCPACATSSDSLTRSAPGPVVWMC